MRTLLVAIIIISICGSACKTKQVAVDENSDNSNNNNSSTTNGLTLGKISHKYRASGCATVVLVEQKDNPGEELTLIPAQAFPSTMDVDGLEIYFDYRLLRMPNPEGCSTGIPAEFQNVRVKTDE